MSDSQNFDFGRFVPGFDFLQNLAKGASEAMPQMPGLGSWVAPTLSTEELDKRISELRAVQFWLEQNGRALQATIQALEVQKMTLSTLEGMNMSMADLTEAMKLKPQTDEAPAGRRAGGAKAQAAPQVIDPLQWWNALTQQFQQIATGALQEAAQSNPMEAAREMATDMAQGAMDAARRMGEAAVPSKPPARKAAPRKSAPRKAAATRKSAR